MRESVSAEEDGSVQDIRMVRHCGCVFENQFGTMVKVLD